MSLKIPLTLIIADYASQTSITDCLKNISSWSPRKVIVSNNPKLTSSKEIIDTVANYCKNVRLRRIDETSDIVEISLSVELDKFDDVIDLKHTKNLIKSFPKEQIDIKMILNKGHNDISLDEKYYLHLYNFILK